MRSLLPKLAVPVVGSGFLASCASYNVAAPTVVPLFSPDRILVAGRPQRIPIGLVTPSDGLGQGGNGSLGDGNRVALPADDSPISISVMLDGETIDQAEVVGRVVDHDHVGEVDPDHQHANLFRYYPLRVTLEEPGIYDLEIEVTDAETGERAISTMPVQIFDRDEAVVPIPGEPFPPLITPTVDQPGIIDRLCTRFEICPFHTVSADEVMAAGRPMALLVATPAFCSTAYCGPVLDTMIAEAEAFPDIEFIHVEVYENTDEVEGNYQDPRIRLAPAVIDIGLTFEPSLFLVDSTGMLIDRIDNVFDGTELAEALQTLA